MTAAIPIIPLRKDDLAAFLGQNPALSAWVEAIGFAAEPGTHCVVPSREGTIESVLLGPGTEPMWDWASLPEKLPRGVYRIAPALPADEAADAAFGWALATYRFDRYRTQPRASPPCSGPRPAIAPPCSRRPKRPSWSAT